MFSATMMNNQNDYLNGFEMQMHICINIVYKFTCLLNDKKKSCQIRENFVYI